MPKALGGTEVSPYRARERRSPVIRGGVVFGSILPKEARFFELFRQQAAKNVEGCKAFQTMLGDLEHAPEHSRRIKDLEHEGDVITHKTIELLHKTFITPFDRDDMHRLMSRLDDVLDFVEASSQRVYLYGITKATDPARELAVLVVSSAELVEKAVRGLENLKEPEAIRETCMEINRVEHEADAILHSAVAALFRDETDIKTLIKWKEIYDYLETATDRCEDVANIIEGMVLEQA
jgi:predicted phosphate transport protein (TIGR00153 family)